MKLTWLGHACFLVEQGGYRILLDPYTGVEGYPSLAETARRTALWDNVWEERARRKEQGFYTLAVKTRVFVDGEAAPPAEPKLQVHKILCSHGHFDHNAVEEAEVVPFDGPCPFTIRTVETFHDDQGGALRGPNTIHILSADGVTIAHLGDLGHPLSPEQLAAVGPLDVVLIPVGGTYTVDAAGAKAVCGALRPKCAVPMHYRHAPYGLPNVAGVEDFLSLWDEGEIHRLEGPALEVDGTARGVVVPQYCEEA
nr:MBL fold metallo-hydrolase [uncultured Oscillibacter sp.]